MMKQLNYAYLSLQRKRAAVKGDGEMNAENRTSYEPNHYIDSESAPGGVIVYYADGDEEIIHVNQYVIDLLECDSFDDFMQFTGGSFRDFVYREDIGAAEDSIWGQVASQGNFDHIFYRVKTKTGRLVQIEDFGRLVETPDSRPVFNVFIVEMKEWGTVDWLTGLPTMSRFHNLANLEAQRMRERGERPVTIALDFMGLKTFNSQYGRTEGDRLLSGFADVLRKHFGYEACSRFSEDHFYALSMEEGIQGRINNLFADAANCNGGKVLPLRVGLYACDPDDDIVEVGFDRARFACDLDRKTWQSHAVWFSDELKAKEDFRTYVCEHLDEAIAKQWLRPYYQGIVRASTGVICGEEALARWTDPVYGELCAEAFIPYLEEAGLLQRVDMHIIECVFQDMLAKRRTQTPIVPVSVNISLSDVGKIDLAREIVQRADALGVSRSLLRVEFTESSLSEGSDKLRAQIQALHAEGIEVWLDDFGSGYSSLSTLREYSFDLIKISESFIEDINNEKARNLMRAIVKSAGKQGIGTLAKGVETEEQDRFLASIGCNMLQGFYYTTANPVGVIMGRCRSGEGLPREDMTEFAYWNTVGTVDLSDPTSTTDDYDVDGNPLSEFPAGVMELRGDTWNVLRANDAYREFLYSSGITEVSSARFSTIVPKYTIDADFVAATERCRRSGRWERVGGRLEYGLGLQFYVRPIASSRDADAFAIASVPNTLGTALGTYGDVPVAYAVLRVDLNARGDAAVDAEYIFANSVFCEWTNRSQEEVPGSSFTARVARDEADEWLSRFYRAVETQESVHDVDYSPTLGHWLSYDVAPSPVRNCVVFAFSFADKEGRERQEMMIGLGTSDMIIRVTDMLNRVSDYDAAMNRVLQIISETIRPKRLFILERKGDTTSFSYEWCAPGVSPLIKTLPDLPSAELDRWRKAARQSSVIAVSDVEQLKSVSDRVYQYLKNLGVSRLFFVTLYAGGQIVGYLSATDYELHEELDIRRLIETTATAISARIANKRLLEELERTGTHDGLTRLLNRRGIDLAIETELHGNPDRPFVLALIDVDDFKTLNDVHGHAVGDEALQTLARILTTTFSENCVLGRNGGDEFLVMLFDDEVERAEALFTSITQSRLNYFFKGKHYQASISIGYVEHPAQAETLEAAYTMADVALYSVKLSGKANCQKYSSAFELQYRSSLAFSSRALTEKAPNGVLVLDANDTDTVLYANSQFTKLVGCDGFSEFMRYADGQLSNVVYPNDRARVRSMHLVDKALTREDAPHRCEFRLVSKMGEIHDIVANSRLVDMDQIGEVFYMSLVEK